MTPHDVARWVDRHYRPERLNRDPDSRDRIVAERIRDLNLYGSTLVSRHDSITGRAEWIRTEEAP